MNTLPILTIQAAERLLHTLEDLLEKSEASFAMIIDRGGIVLSQHGELPDHADPTIVAALAAGSFAATRELALRVGETDCSALYQQGAHHHILVSAVDDDIVLVTVFGKQTTVGLVKFYSAKTIKRVSAVLQELRSTEQVGVLFTKDDLNSAEDLFLRGRE